MRSLPFALAFTVLSGLLTVAEAAEVTVREAVEQSMRSDLPSFAAQCRNGRIQTISRWPDNPLHFGGVVVDSDPYSTAAHATTRCSDGFAETLEPLFDDRDLPR